METNLIICPAAIQLKQLRSYSCIRFEFHSVCFQLKSMGLITVLSCLLTGQGILCFPHPPQTLSA